MADMNERVKVFRRSRTKGRRSWVFCRRTRKPGFWGVSRSS